MRRGHEPGEADSQRLLAAKDAGKTADDLPGLKELDAADRKLAEKQKYCPVSGELLGSIWENRTR